MADFLTPAQRSERMSRIKSRDTKPELVLRSAMHRKGFRFRVNDTRLPGKPDIVFPKYRAAVFVHGCFWHRHPGCSIATTPKSNTAFWMEKFDRNVARDARSREALEASGWRVFTVWECDLKSSAKIAEAAARLAEQLLASRPTGHAEV
ncbi:very short patch repair endonuclease [Caulobacter flavus]|uniref:Very short patch repair endonuclease n=1 Tax=Caulobacter flavus TaxID=1679497 RepID=A0A2N5CZJ9_9CAUL|nr:DNA mismatch endonuclease Vsr [Caulobacter flavus]AYV45099.1 very short patch repair endonuclease [Caulobacter flavus]PLR19221.1 very short patch repair endonuclease [Caulobacter flavus]